MLLRHLQPSLQFVLCYQRLLSHLANRFSQENHTLANDVLDQVSAHTTSFSPIRLPLARLTLGPAHSSPLTALYGA